jgi:hypothetical protein
MLVLGMLLSAVIYVSQFSKLLFWLLRLTVQMHFELLTFVKLTCIQGGGRFPYLSEPCFVLAIQHGSFF